MSKHFVEHRVTGRFGTIENISNKFVLVRLHHRDGFELWTRQNCLCYTSVVRAAQ